MLDLQYMCRLTDAARGSKGTQGTKRRVTRATRMTKRSDRGQGPAHDATSARLNDEGTRRPHPDQEQVACERVMGCCGPAGSPVKRKNIATAYAASLMRDVHMDDVIRAAQSTSKNDDRDYASRHVGNANNINDQSLCAHRDDNRGVHDDAPSPMTHHNAHTHTKDRVMSKIDRLLADAAALIAEVKRRDAQFRARCDAHVIAYHANRFKVAKRARDARWAHCNVVVSS